MLEIRNMTKRFGAVAAVEDATFSLRHGEFFSLLGPSGCGKTTLLRLVAGFERPTSGLIAFSGRSIEGAPPHSRPFNMVFQNYALFPHLDVQANVAFGLKMKKVPRPEIVSRVEEALDLVAMTGYEQRSVGTLSGGQQQRVAIARAIVNRPQVLLLDEPLAALDLKLRERMQVELKALQRRLGIAFLYVTHAQDEALALSDRIAVMNGGRIEQIGRPEEIYHEPTTRFVADFIGSVNAIAAKVVRREGNVITVRSPIGAVAIRSEMDWQPGASGTLLVRPECVRVSLSTGAGDGVIREVLFKGSHAVVVIACQAETIIAEVRTQTFASGQSVNVAFSGADARLIKGNPT